MRLKTQIAKKDYKTLAAIPLVALVVGHGGHKNQHKRHHHKSPHAYVKYSPGCHTRKCSKRMARLWRKHHPLPKWTGYVVKGLTSTFGYPAEGGTTADGGSTARPCIAIRDDSTLGHMFRVTVLGHSATLLHCDWGPASFTGRAIDITGLGASALGFSQAGFPTGAYGVAKEIRMGD